MSLFKMYTNQFYWEFGYLPTWDPGSKRELGDILEKTGTGYHRQGNVKELGIKVEIAPDPTRNALIEWKSKQGVTIEPGAQATVRKDLVDAKVAFTFKSNRVSGFYLRAKDVCFDMLSNNIELGEKIKELYAGKKWNINWVVITELVVAGSATIIISESTKSELQFEIAGTANTQVVDIADASLKFNVTFDKDVGYYSIAKEGLTPAFKLHKLKSFKEYGPTRSLDREEKGEPQFGEITGDELFMDELLK
jgi:hypothetical protein